MGEVLHKVADIFEVLETSEDSATTNREVVYYKTWAEYREARRALAGLIRDDSFFQDYRNSAATQRVTRLTKQGKGFCSLDADGYGFYRFPLHDGSMQKIKLKDLRSYVSVLDLSDLLFAWNTTLESFHASVNGVDYSAFMRCPHLQDVRLDFVKEECVYCNVQSKAFLGCSDLHTVLLSGQLDTIGAEAFAECENLTRLSLPDSVSLIDTKAFTKTGLGEFIAPASLSAVDSGAFAHCENLRRADFSKVDEMVHIWYDVFEDCKALQEVILPKSIRKVGGRIFHDCPSLRSVRLPDNIEEWSGSQFFDKHTEVIITKGSMTEETFLRIINWESEKYTVRLVG